MGLSSRVMGAEETIDSLNTKIAATEKSKHRLEAELEEISMEYERTHAAAVITEKRAHNFDKVVGEWKCKADDLMAELDACRSEARNYSSEVYRLKAAHEEAEGALEAEENKVLRAQLELGQVKQEID